MMRSIERRDPSDNSRNDEILRRGLIRGRHWAFVIVLAAGCAPLPRGDGNMPGASAEDDGPVVNQYEACRLPWGPRISHDTHVDGFSEKSLPAGDDCDRVKAELICRGGTLWLADPSLDRSEEDFIYGTCTVASTTPDTTTPDTTTPDTTTPDTTTPDTTTPDTTTPDTTTPDTTTPDTTTPDTTTPDTTTPDTTTPDTTTPEPPPAILTCTAPSGDTLEPGDSVQLFSTTRVAFGQTCAAYAQVRTCMSDGALSGDSAYSQANCIEDQASACTLPWGGSLSHGGSVTAYLTGTAAPGASCQQEVRICSNGQLTGSYTHANCSDAEYVALYGDGAVLGTSLHTGAWAFGFSADFTNGQNRPHFQRIFSFQNLTSQGCFLFFLGNVNIIEATFGNPDIHQRIPSLGSAQGLYVPPGLGTGPQVNVRIYPMADVQYSSEFVFSCHDMSGVPHNIPVHIDIAN
ncbi:MAG: hypothetical protein H6729_02635 [Deltaproteobacteria bacterium]|nr:hypothetical protein [Deltaproteobacteria bacterium]